MTEFRLMHGDCLELMKGMESKSVNCCVTSPPYFGLRDYGMEGQIGLEPTPDEFVAALVAVFREVRRVLRDDGTLWLNLGDSYGKGKQLLGIPWRVAFALQTDGWVVRQDIIWQKPNPMPESVRDRCTKAHEYMFLLSKAPRYYFDGEAVKEPVAASSVARLSQPNIAQQVGSARVPGKTNGNMKAVGNGETRNRRSVWNVATRPYKGAHFATFPPALIEPCILAGCPEGGTVLDPFSGSGTTGAVSVQHGRNYIGIDLNAEYNKLAKARIEAAYSAPEAALLASCSKRAIAHNIDSHNTCGTIG